MAEKQTTSKTPPEKQTPLETDGNLGINHLTEAIVGLNITRKNIQVYPDGHDQIKQSIARSYNTVSQILSSFPKFIIKVAEKTLIVGDEYLDPQNKLFKEFSSSLKQHEIVSVAFSTGLEKSELLGFLRLIANKPDHIREKGGIETLAHEYSLYNVKIKTVDFSKLHLTEEKEIIINRKSDEQHQADSIWNDFVNNLTSGIISDSDQSIALIDAGHVSPSELAHFLNEQQLDTIHSVRIFEQFFTEKFNQIDDEPADGQSFQQLDNINGLLQELNPELRRQFLKTTFTKCNQEADSPKTKKILSGLQENFVVEMIKQANEEGQEISPSLIGFVQKITNIKDLGKFPNHQPKTSLENNIPEIHSADADTLFTRENYEHYVTQDYKEMLTDLTSTDKTALPDDTGIHFLEEHAETLEEKQLDFQIARVLIAFMNEDIEPDEYTDYSERLISIINEINISDNSDFSFLKEILITFKMHAIHKSHPELQSIAINCIKEMEKPLFIARAIDAFDKLDDQRSNDPIDFLTILGPKIVPEVVNLYSKSENTKDSAVLINLLSNFSEIACSEAKKRIHDPRPLVAKNIIILIRKLGNQETASHLLGLLEHHDDNVRLETLSALLKFSHPQSGQLLRRLLRSNQPEIVSNAIRLAGDYKVQETAEFLINMIRVPALLKSTIKKNQELIIALGSIGNPIALPILEKLAKTSFTFFPKALSNMKHLIFENINEYPKKEIFSLIKIGIHLNNKKIRKRCQELSNNSDK